MLFGEAHFFTTLEFCSQQLPIDLKRACNTIVLRFLLLQVMILGGDPRAQVPAQVSNHAKSWHLAHCFPLKRVKPSCAGLDIVCR